jgi:hypothetical protein
MRHSSVPDLVRQLETGMDVLTNEYFRLDLQDRLPAEEVQRRQKIKARLESQFERWQTQEQHG